VRTHDRSPRTPDTDRADRLTRLHEQLAPDLLRFFERRVLPIDDAADLLAETYMVAWRRIGRVPTEDEQARMWMFVTARGVLSNWRRGQRRRSVLADELREQLATHGHRVHNETPFVDSAQERVRDAVELLPLSQRELVMLVHWDGFSVIEAARVVGIRESTARGRYQRARASLSARLAELSRRESEDARSVR
jgi:RNA polymerase sigma-70 factor (ECF subfamily)